MIVFKGKKKCNFIEQKCLNYYTHIYNNNNNNNNNNFKKKLGGGHCPPSPKLATSLVLYMPHIDVHLMWPMWEWMGSKLMRRRQCTSTYQKLIGVLV